MTQNDSTVCDACRKIIREGESIRHIHGFKLHAGEECFNVYSVKVEKGILKVPFFFSLANKAKT